MRNRIAKLERAIPQVSTESDTIFDLSRMDTYEMYELDQLLARLVEDEDGMMSTMALTDAQKQRLDELWALFGIEADASPAGE